MDSSHCQEAVGLILGMADRSRRFLPKEESQKTTYLPGRAEQVQGMAKRQSSTRNGFVKNLVKIQGKGRAQIFAG